MLCCRRDPMKTPLSTAARTRRRLKRSVDGKAIGISLSGNISCSVRWLQVLSSFVNLVFLSLFLFFFIFLFLFFFFYFFS